MTAPPDTFFTILRERDRDEARQFYKKYIEVDGMPVVAAAEVADKALLRPERSSRTCWPDVPISSRRWSTEKCT